MNENVSVNFNKLRAIDFETKYSLKEKWTRGPALCG
jgi:hypothetical protein